jgi:hypothetical protein
MLALQIALGSLYDRLLDAARLVMSSGIPAAVNKARELVFNICCDQDTSTLTLFWW